MTEKKTVIVTGGAQGIGKVVSADLYDEGYNVCVTDIDNEAIGQMKDEMANKELLYIKADVGNENEVKKVIKKTVEKYNNIFGIVNNAAIANNKFIGDMSFDEWKRVIDTNLSSVFLMAKYGCIYLKTVNGVIINISSTRAIMSEKNTEAYSASKGGVISVTHSLAISLGPEIRVNCISPGWIETGDLKKIKDRKVINHSKEDKEQHPVGRVGNASDISEMIKYLISEKAGFITGQNFIIDGGITKRMIYV